MNPDLDRPTTQSPVVPKGTLSYELCASLHNAIWKYAWAGGAPDTCPDPPPTWWEYYNPPETIAARLNPDLIEFLKRAYYHKAVPVFFSLLVPLTSLDHLLGDPWFILYEADRFIFLHYTTGFSCGDELGLAYDQWNAKAAFIHLFDHKDAVCENGYGWVPLDYVYSSYLEMIHEGKVEPLSSPGEKWSRQPTHDDFGPFRLYGYTPVDVDKSLCALRRLLDSIHARLPHIGNESESSDGNEAQTTQHDVFPWTDPSALEALDITSGTFAHDFLSQVAKLVPPVAFRYLAPGIRLQTPDELPSALLKWARPERNCSPPPLLLFRADYLSSSPAPGPSASREYRISLFSHCVGFPDVPPGLYLSNHEEFNYAFSNGSRLVLPFGIGAAGWARLSDGEGMGISIFSDTPEPQDICDDLYQSGFNSCGPERDVQLHKILNSWADRVEAGDWDVGRDGVSGGIEKFREADTPDEWRKYWLPPSW